MKERESSRLIMDMSVHGIDDFDEFGYYNYVNVQPVLPTHAHPGMIEICFMIKGSQTYFVGNEKYDVKGADIFVTFPDEIHGTGNGPEEKGILYWIVLKRPCKDRTWFGLSAMDAAEIFGRLLSLPARLFKSSSKIEHLLQKIVKRYFCIPDALVSQMDLFASLASLLGQDVPEGLDSKSMPEVFFGGSNEGRESLVLGSDGKLTFRLGKLHLIPPYPGYAVDPTGTETGYSDDWALYDLAADSTEHVRVR